MKLSCRGVLFDVDGVLVDSTAAGETAWRQWATEYGLDPDVVLQGVHGRRSAETVRLHLPLVLHGPALRRINTIKICDAISTSPVPGARDLLSSLAANWGVVTSASPGLLAARFAAAGLPPPPVTITGDDVTRGKPDPEGYLRGATGLGLPVSECVIFEDSPVGVAAGLAARPAEVVGVGLRAPAAVAVRDLRGIRWTGNGLRLPHRLRRSADEPRARRRSP
ncbi:HAD-IA family hydrolase [Lentzea sp. JNUCC 0626]|uniref:HAD-IA family hydrolase n=1 Tax=Lentzea sp. JNUCC 0626 TaxID=3367513 RepID=UPI003749BCC4